MLCTNKIRVIYFCPNCVNFLPKNLYFVYFVYFIFFIIIIFGGRRGGDGSPYHPLPLPALAPDHALSVEYYICRYFYILNSLNCSSLLHRSLLLACSTTSFTLKLPFYKFVDDLL